MTARNAFPHRRLSGLRAAAVVAVVALVAAACTDAPTDTDSSGEGGSSGDVIVHALGGEPEGLDPAQVPAGGYGDRVIIQVYDFLVDMPPEGSTPIPMIATEVPTQENGLVSEDGLVYTFPIREGVKFHDGTDLDANSVKFSWDRVMEMDLPEGQADTLNQIVESTKVVDDYTFEVTLKEPAAWFLTSVAYSVPAAIVSPTAVEDNGGVEAGVPNEWMNTNMVGSGPYKFVSWDRNERVNFEVNEDYWGEKATNDAQFLVSADNAATVIGLQAGDIDIVEPVPQFVDQLAGNENICVEEDGYLLEPMQLAFNLNIDESTLPEEDTIPADFFWDKRVRQAFNYAFDYDAYLEAGLSGHGEVASYIPPALLGASEDNMRYEQDLDKAEELFKETGWWDEGFTASVLVEANNPTFTPVGLVLKDSLAALNPKFQINVLEVAEAQFDEAHATTPFEYPMWIKNGDPFGDPHFLMNTYFHPDGEWGQRLGYRNGYEDPDAIASLIDEASEETDFDRRAELYQEVIPLLYDDPMWIWPADEANIQIHQCSIEGFVYNPLWIMPRWAFYSK